MGLSNEERLTQIYSIVSNLNDLAIEFSAPGRYIEGYEQSRHLCLKIAQMWHALLRSSNNSIHWLAGSDSTRPVTDSACSPWSIAIRQHISRSIFAADNLASATEQKTEENHKFDPFRHSLNIDRLLEPTLSFIFQVYQEIESLIYYVRRYDDELRNNLATLDQLVSDCAGICFSAFGNANYAKAYVLNQIAQILYGPNYEYIEASQHDLVQQVLSEHNMHHLLGAGMKLSLPELMNHHMDLLSSDSLDFTRILKAIQVSSPGYHYAHQHQKLISKLELAGWSEDSVNAIALACESCKKPEIPVVKEAPNNLYWSSHRYR